MKKLIALMTLALALNVSATNVDDLFAGGEREFEFDRFADNSILLAIDEEAEMACSNGVCTLHAVTNNYGGFEVAFNVGEGNSNSNGGGTNIYTGNGGYNTNGDSEHWGFTVKYRRGACTQRIKVPKSVYYAINRYMFGLMTEEGGTRRGFTPADEAMIMFYTTIMSRANGCTMQ
ncbi:hypothetical protein A9Q84_02650 [Halobacteriovorax marinus]|uniref:Secreted protein n=1 Tax=Halobacteriovorax marinus TaxID=97084 RepID=A0A1Y5FCY3_9BACT|nr:hypothetical protein A9Q84_02650 [Halobacteriovorax marinus]